MDDQLYVFPDPIRADPHYNGIGSSLGMTLRDYFAVKALQGILASVHTLPQAEMDIVNQAYAYADEMLAAREN